MKIKEAKIVDSNHRYGDLEFRAVMDNGDGDLEFRAIMDNGEKDVFVFCWFSDELKFTAEEIVGLTIEEARDLKQARDIAYLQS